MLTMPAITAATDVAGTEGGAPASMIVTLNVFCVPSVVPLGFASVRITVLSALRIKSLMGVTVKVADVCPAGMRIEVVERVKLLPCTAVPPKSRFAMASKEAAAVNLTVTVTGPPASFTDVELPEN